MDAGNKQDLATRSLFDHVPGDQLADVKPAYEHALNDPLEVRGVVIEEVASLVAGGIADENIDPPGCLKCVATSCSQPGRLKTSASSGVQERPNLGFPWRFGQDRGFRDDH